MPIDKEKIPGWWANHPYKRHSVWEIEEFVGWGKLLKLSSKGDNIVHRALPATLFSTGCRISEALQLRLSNFDLSIDGFVRCVKVPIVKQRNIKLNPTRTFSFPSNEPLWPRVKELLDLKHQLKNRKNKDPLLFNYCRSHSWRLVKKMGAQVGLTVWNHYFRSQRASQIGYEYKFTENELMEWFKVIDPTWARRYCKKGDYGLREVMIERKPNTWRM